MIELDSLAIVVDPKRDNVAVAKTDIDKNTVLRFGGDEVTVAADISMGHRFAIKPIEAGGDVLQYAQPFGRSKGISAGEAITPHSMETVIPVSHGDLTLVPDPLTYLPPADIPTIDAFLREDGRVGIRNWVLVIPTSMCSSHEASTISMQAEATLYSREKYPNVDGVAALPHTRGCGCPDGGTVSATLTMLARYMNHPNVGAVLVMELGCEKTDLKVFNNFVSKHMEFTGKPVKTLSVQDAGGTQGAIEEGLKLLPELLEAANQSTRETLPASTLILGTKCGGSDAFSGLSANPAVGRASDRLIEAGGTSMITEIPEFFGAEHLFATRGVDQEAAGSVLDAMNRFSDYTARIGHSMSENPSPGNRAGGLINITIKSLGALAKSGRAPVQGVVDYGALVPSGGLHLLYCPSYDQESTPALVASGAQMVVFTTGRGTGIGNAIAPVIKVATNTPMYDRMSRDMDLNAGGVIDGDRTIAEVGDELFDLILEVASGREVAAEKSKHREFTIWSEEGISL